MKVMICDGDAERAKVLYDLLNVYKLQLVTVNRNLDLFKQIENHKPAVIILNEKFAPKLGSAMIARLRSNPVSKKIPIIFISAGGQSIDSTKLHSDSLITMMQEPFKIKYLRHCIDRWTTFRCLNMQQ
jgi:DNA-binding response OmpR family regulator